MIKLHTDYPIGLGVVFMDDIRVIQELYSSSTRYAGNCGSCAWFIPDPEAADREDRKVQRTMDFKGGCLQVFPLILPTRTVYTCVCYQPRPQEYTDRMNDPLLEREEEEILRSRTRVQKSIEEQQDDMS